jgi:hypothetical protein
LDEANNQFKKKINGYTNEPLTLIGFINCIIDILHMWLRITDKLRHLLNQKIDLYGNLLRYFCLIFIFYKIKFNVKDKMNKITPLSENSYLGKYLNFIENEAGIKCAYYKKEKEIEMRSLNGAEKLRIFEKINLIDLFPRLDDVENINKLWSSFFKIYESIRNGNYENK